MPPVAMIPTVKEALKGSGMEVFCDCHFDSGYDAYKALAMGANAVAPGRILLYNKTDKSVIYRLCFRLVQKVCCKVSHF